MVSGCLWLLALLSVAHATEPVSTCSPTRVFSATGATSIADDFLKISESEILGARTLVPAMARSLSAGTELSAVVDLDCLAARDPSVQGHGLRSILWKFGRDRSFDELREAVERDKRDVRLANTIRVVGQGLLKTLIRGIRASNPAEVVWRDK